eukprot:jgi/Psemu1/317565/estExt_fgenesh1_pm.C_180017
MKTISLIAGVTTVGILGYWSRLCQCFTGNVPLRMFPGSGTSKIHHSRIDVRNLLTQRAIQSFMFLCEECRDPHSGKWIEDFLETQNLLNYHGTGASFMADVPWDGPLLSIMEQPNDVMIVSAKRRGRGHGGWSKNNPYLPDRYVEFKINIDPSSLTERILAVREQLAAEWVNDLGILGRANQQILESYFRLARDERNQDGGGASPAVAFERTAVDALNTHTAFGATGSPFRKGSFDLLYNLCTQASIHRLLLSLREAGDEANLTLLRDFYVDRLEEFFDGDLPYGRADDFIEELLLLSPSIIHRGDGQVTLTDPFGISEKIIEARNDIVSEWIEAMKLVPTAHQEGVRKRLLDKRMEAWNAYTGKTPESGNSTSGTGGFQ